MAVCSNVYDYMRLLGEHGESLSFNDIYSLAVEKTAGFRLRGSTLHDPSPTWV